MATEATEWNSKGGSNLYAQIRSPKVSLVYPDLVDRIRKQQAKSLLDFGCGSGIFLSEFSSSLGIKQFGYDVDAEMISLAQKNCTDHTNTDITSNLGSIGANTIDAITHIALWMVLKSEQDCLECLRSMHALLSESGRMYAAITHPCFRDRAFSGNILHLDMNNYLKDSVTYKAEIKDNQKTMELTNYHYSLSSISKQLAATGFVIEEIHEYPDVVPHYQGSPWMLITAKKQ